MNETRNTNCLITEITSTEPLKIVINSFRFGIIFFYALWLIIALCVKELRNRQMAFLINISASGIYSSISVIYLIFRTSCSNEPPEMITCFLLNLNTLFASYYTSYSFSALAVHRMICSYSLQLKKWLQWKFLIPSLALTWIFPYSLVLVQMFSFKSNYYNQFLSACSYEIYSHIGSFIFYITFVIILPNVIILTSYLMVLIKLRNIKRRSCASVSRVLEPPRITLQLCIYFIMFEIGSLSNLFLTFQRTQFVVKLSDDALVTLQVTRWFPGFCPLGLLYFHSSLLKKYKKLLCNRKE